MKGPKEVIKLVSGKFYFHSILQRGRSKISNGEKKLIARNVFLRILSDQANRIPCTLRQSGKLAGYRQAVILIVISTFIDWEFSWKLESCFFDLVLSALSAILIFIRPVLAPDPLPLFLLPSLTVLLS